MIGPYSLARIQTLQPAIRPIAETFLAKCAEAGVPCDIIQGTRTFAEQQTVYEQGRSEPGAIVTNAKPGDSYHQYGLAFDAVPAAYRTLPNWNPTGKDWQTIGAIGRSLGLEWGGDWVKKDFPHFQLAAAPIAELKAYWEKFKQVMPIEITPTSGGLAIIVLIGAIWLFFVRPQLSRSGLL